MHYLEITKFLSSRASAMRAELATSEVRLSESAIFPETRGGCNSYCGGSRRFALKCTQRLPLAVPGVWFESTTTQVYETKRWPFYNVHCINQLFNSNNSWHTLHATYVSVKHTTLTQPQQVCGVTFDIFVCIVYLQNIIRNMFSV